MKNKTVKTIISVLFIILTASALLFFADDIRTSILQNFTLAVQTVIPGLFPFLILSQTLAQTGFPVAGGKRSDKIMQRIFGLPSQCILPILFGLNGGYLAGIKTVGALYKNGNITEAQAKKLCRFCVAPGPAFAISAVGQSIFKNPQSGILLFASCTLASVFMGICTKKEPLLKLKNTVDRHCEPFAIAFTRAVQLSADACFSLSAWMAVFATVQAVMLQVLPTVVQPSFLLFSEVTGGVIQAGNIGNLPLCAAVLGFGGLCIFCQMLPDLQKMNISVSLFLRDRLLQGGLSALFCRIGLAFFPTADLSVPTSAVQMCRSSPLSSFFLLFICFIFILDLAPREKTWYTVGGR